MARFIEKMRPHSAASDRISLVSIFLLLTTLKFCLQGSLSVLLIAFPGRCAKELALGLDYSSICVLYILGYGVRSVSGAVRLHTWRPRHM